MEAIKNATLTLYSLLFDGFTQASVEELRSLGYMMDPNDHDGDAHTIRFSWYAHRLHAGDYLNTVELLDCHHCCEVVMLEALLLSVGIEPEAAPHQHTHPFNVT